MKKVLVSIAILLMLVVMVFGCAQPAPLATTVTTTVAVPTKAAPTQTYEWKISQPYTKGAILYDLTEDFISRLRAASNGRMVINHYPGDLLGDYLAVNKNVSLGKQEMAITWPSTGDNPKWDVNNVPFVCRTFKEAFDAYSPGKWAYNAHLDIAEETHWHLLGEVPLGFTGVVSNVKFDPMPVAKNVKTRVMAGEGAKKTVEVMGLQPVTIPWSEISSSLKLGTIDAAWGATSSDDFKQFFDVYKYAYMYRSNFANTLFIMNRDIYQSLPEGDKDILSRVTVNWVDHAWSYYMSYEAKTFAELEESGKLIYLTAEEWTVNAEVQREQTWSFYEQNIGKAIMDIIRANAVPLPVPAGTDAGYSID